MMDTMDAEMIEEGLKTKIFSILVEREWFLVYEDIYKKTLRSILKQAKTYSRRPNQQKTVMLTYGIMKWRQDANREKIIQKTDELNKLGFAGQGRLYPEPSFQELRAK